MVAIDIRDCPNHAVLVLDGEIDLVTAPAVRAGLGAIVDDNTDRTVVVDLRDVTFMDSTGVGALLSAYRRLKLQQRPMVVAQPQPIVARVLGIINVELVIPIVDSLSVAVGDCPRVHRSASLPALSRDS